MSYMSFEELNTIEYYLRSTQLAIAKWTAGVIRIRGEKPISQEPRTARVMHNWFALRID